MIQAEVGVILQHTALIPVFGFVESALLFPLFIAGSETMDHDSLDIIRVRMRGMSRKRDFNNIQQALCVLEEVWKRRNGDDHGNGDCDVDWRDVVGQREEHLLLT
jgi:hypothetical protein